MRKDSISTIFSRLFYLLPIFFSYFKCLFRKIFIDVISSAFYSIIVRWPCRMTLTWSPYGIFLRFLLIWSKWILVKNDQNPVLFVLVGKEIVCRLQKCCWILFPPMKVRSYNRKTPVFAEIYSFCRKRPIRNRFSKNKNKLRFLRFFKILYFSKISMEDQTSTMSSSS